MMNLLTKAATAAVLSMALASAPAAARGWHRGHGHGGHHRHHGGGIGTVGGIILGAALLGSVAAIASDNRRDRYEPRYAPQPVYGGGYGSNYEYDDQYAQVDPRAVPPAATGDDYADEPDGYDRPEAASNPVDDCSRAAERQAQNGGGFARVVGIDRVDNFDGGANVRGRVEVDNGRSGPIRRMSFSCSARFGEVTQLRFG